MGACVSIDLRIAVAAAFDAMVEELSLAFTRLGMELRPGAGGSVRANGREVGRIIRWRPAEEIELDWLEAEWQRARVGPVRLRFERTEQGTRVTIERPDAAGLLGDEGHELAGWFSSEVAAPFLHAMTPERLGDWITDRRARRPAGPEARAIYRDPLYHRPNFKAILKTLELKPEDFLVEVGCGGGAFLKDALSSGCRAVAVDHSPDMVRVARELNRQSIEEKRLEIREAKADALPFPDAKFTCAVMTGVFGFITRPLEVLREVRRVLLPGGRLVLFAGSKQLRGTPAAPEPIASRLNFYEDAELQELARRAGFRQARLEYPDFEPLAREAGVPEEAMELFRGRGGGQLLVAQK